MAVTAGLSENLDSMKGKGKGKNKGKGNRENPLRIHLHLRTRMKTKIQPRSSKSFLTRQMPKQGLCKR